MSLWQPAQTLLKVALPAAIFPVAAPDELDDELLELAAELLGLDEKLELLDGEMELLETTGGDLKPPQADTAAAAAAMASQRDQLKECTIMISLYGGSRSSCGSYFADVNGYIID